MLEGVGPLLGVGGGGFSLLWEDDVEEGAFWCGAGGVLPRLFLLKGGGGGGAEVLCFIPLLEEELLLEGREMSGSEGRWECCCSGGEGLLAGEGDGERPVGGRGAAGRVPGGRRADLPTEPPARPSEKRTVVMTTKNQ